MPVKRTGIGALMVLLFISVGCAPCHRTDAVTQGALINTLLAGLYDGMFTQNDVAAWGDLGIGTFDRLDGEMIVLDGVTYQANTRGEIRIMTRFTTPFATVKHFSADTQFLLTGPLTLDALKAVMDAHLTDRNHVYAIRIRGRFAAVTVRSVPPQEKPYPLLTEVVKTQPVWERKDLDGTLVGFFVPAYAQGMNVAGYHFHFLSDAKDFGGHVLALDLAEGKAALDRADEWRIALPDDEAFRSWGGVGQGDAAVKAVESKE